MKIDSYSKEQLQVMIVRILLQVLGNSTMEIYRMRVEQQLSFRQIAEYMRMSKTAVFSRYQKARTLINDNLTPPHP